MKPSSCLALLALLPLGCGGEMPAVSAPSAAAPAQRPAEITVVDLSPPAPKAPPPPKAAEVVADPDGPKEAVEFGMIGLLGSGAVGDPNAPTAPWGKDDSGTDPSSAKGSMWGDSIGDSFGAGGLGLAGTGGGGTGIGIGTIGTGTIGHGAGTGTGQGFGSGSGRLAGANSSKPPQIRIGATTVAGRLPPEVIQRIVRQNFGRFRLCYENGLRSNPKLEGNVSVHFVIEKDGSVSGGSVVQGTDLPDSGVASCVVRAFNGLSFPQPDGGKVTVTYPIKFSPGDPAPAPAAKAPPAAAAKPAPAVAPAAAPPASKSP